MDINNQLVTALSQVQRPGQFYATGKTELALPRITVDGVGILALPFLPQQLPALVAVAEQAPYGRGTETLVDTNVRKTWQIAADQVQITGKYWQNTLNNIVSQVTADLGVTGTVDADLYKLLVYDEGSFFVNHRDTEKAEGMFATLIVALPALYEGGELRIEHLGQSVSCQLQTDDPSEIAFAAFYADCIHEVLPITQGCRLVLVYNLCLKGQQVLPQPPNYQTAQQQTAWLLHRWATMEHTGEEDIPLKLVYLLEHAYTPDGLAFNALKNADAAVANVLISAAEQADCELYLALVSVEESGWAEYNGDWGYSRRKKSYADDEGEYDDFEVGEVTESYQYISQWCTPQGHVNLAQLPFEDEELCLAERLRPLKPNELHFEEATGNAGASFERTYHRAALVLWPRAYRADALSAGGLSIMLPYLHNLIRIWQASGTNTPQSEQWQEAYHFAKVILRDWPELSPTSCWYDHYIAPVEPNKTSYLSSFLDALVDLQAIDLIQQAVQKIVITRQMYVLADNPSLVRSLALLPASTAIALINTLVEQNATKHWLACGDLLCAVYSPYAVHQTESGFWQAANALVTTVGTSAATAINMAYASRALAGLAPDTLVATISGVAQVSEELGKRLVDRLLALPALFAMDTVLIPSVLCAETTSHCPRAVVSYFNQGCLAYLTTQIATPLQPPSDWARAADFTCATKDADCMALQTFLRDPQQAVWEFKAIQERRTKLENIANHAKIDADCETIRRGSPHTLRITKNQASYSRKVAQRQLDEKHYAQLLALQQRLAD